ncbi:HetZ-related protein 2 [Leptodesmis sp.]|uniref:HetZ-related protein 2 n=1 Tax=Leptodesmis sp. TaxID=3100501 RepID=UPI0040534E5A
MMLAEKMALAETISDEWQARLQEELPEHSFAARNSIVRWLVGEDTSRFDGLNAMQRQIIEQAMDYRYRILRQRYLGMSPEKAYKGLIQRLSNLFLIRNKVRTWIALSRDRQCTVVDVLEEVIQELLQNDRYMQQQVAWIAQCTRDARLRNALLLASTEEYCLRPIRNQPLLCYRFVNYLRRTQKGGMTQVPTDDFIRLVSEEISPDDSEGSVSLLDSRAVDEYLDTQAELEQQELRNIVQQRFEAYLIEKNVDPQAVNWLRLYLQGRSQEAIAKELNMEVKQIYRLREKVSYHAVKVFASKTQADLVAAWLGNQPKSQN